MSKCLSNCLRPTPPPRLDRLIGWLFDWSIGGLVDGLMGCVASPCGPFFCFQSSEGQNARQFSNDFWTGFSLGFGSIFMVLLSISELFGRLWAPFWWLWALRASFLSSGRPSGAPGRPRCEQKLFFSSTSLSDEVPPAFAILILSLGGKIESVFLNKYLSDVLLRVSSSCFLMNSSSFSKVCENFVRVPIIMTARL